MYCPNCGQQQVSDEMRFCSRCGLALSGLAEWLAGGLLVRRTEEPRLPSKQRKNIRRAAKLMFFSIALFPLFLLMSIGIDEPGPLALPAFLFFVSLMWMAYARLFMDGDRADVNQFVQPPLFAPASARVTLPPASNLPMPDIGRSKVRTNELAHTPSVTEHTTTLLDKD